VGQPMWAMMSVWPSIRMEGAVCRVLFEAF
jgi:hypothetical protein